MDLQKDENINHFVPSVINPRAVRRSADPNLSQVSTTSRFSLSLKKKSRQALRDISQTPIENISCTKNLLQTQIQDVKIDKENTTLSLFSSRHSLSSDFDNHEGNHSKTKISLKEYCHDTKEKEECSVNKNISIENIERLSTCSSITQLYDPLEYRASGIQDCSPVPNSIYTIQSDDQLLFKINKSSRTMELVSKRKSTLENNFQKRNKSETSDNSVILILNKTAVTDYSEIVIEPPHFKLTKRNQTNQKKHKTVKLQRKITEFLKCTDSKKHPLEKTQTSGVSSDDDCVFVCGEEVEVDSGALATHNVDERLQKHKHAPIKRTDQKPAKCHSAGKSIHSERYGSTSFTPSTRSISKPSSPTLPSHKLVQGTQFAVDAFCYGAIPNVKYYFLTHFHSDHYMGLRKTFSNTLYCSKITADLCILKLSINPRCIKTINPGEKYIIEGVEVMALDANHCPGSIMLVFCLRTGMNILHCGDFRATHTMESIPIFWNKDIHTIYLDTTYCNPRYNFPTQDESIEMALNILARKRTELRRKNRDFSKVLIVCGTYTIGKENFFLRLSECLECAVWASAEKDSVLRTVLGYSFSVQPPHLCQLHVLDMKHITYRDLKVHLENQSGAFSEVVAFKPSGWENGKSATISNNISIHGIPYSEHSSFSEMLRFVQFLRPKLIIPTVPIAGGIKSVQKYFPCPLAFKDDQTQKKISDYHFLTNKKSHAPAIT